MDFFRVISVHVFIHWNWLLYLRQSSRLKLSQEVLHFTSTRCIFFFPSLVNTSWTVPRCFFVAFYSSSQTHPKSQPRFAGADLPAASSLPYTSLDLTYGKSTHCRKHLRRRYQCKCVNVQQSLAKKSIESSLSFGSKQRYCVCYGSSLVDHHTFRNSPRRASCTGGKLACTSWQGQARGLQFDYGRDNRCSVRALARNHPVCHSCSRVPESFRRADSHRHRQASGFFVCELSRLKKNICSSTLARDFVTKSSQTRRTWIWTAFLECLCMSCEDGWAVSFRGHVFCWESFLVGHMQKKGRQYVAHMCSVVTDTPSWIQCRVNVSRKARFHWTLIMSTPECLL